jgi:gliding motility-associated-like protein
VISEAEYKVQAPAVLSIPLADLISDLNENLDPASVSFAEILSSGAKITLTGILSIEVDYSETNYTGLDQLMVEVCDLAGACTQATFNIEVEGPVELEVYNAVSPNGDGSNDYLKISAIERFPENRLRIINRWGNLVYETEGYNNQDRRFEGKGNLNGSGNLPPGTYFYELNLLTEERIINGFLMLQY